MLHIIPLTALSANEAFLDRKYPAFIADCYQAQRLPSDIARRHSKTCSQRNDLPLPEALRRGGRPQTCDQCAQHKVLCDRTQPCKNCLTRGKACTYRRLSPGSSLQSQGNQSSSSSLEPRRDADPTRASHVSIPEDPLQHFGNKCQKTPIRFLLNYTDITNRTILDFRNSLESGRYLGNPKPISEQQCYITPPRELDLEWIDRGAQEYLPLFELHLHEQDFNTEIESGFPVLSDEKTVKVEERLLSFLAKLPTMSRNCGTGETQSSERPSLAALASTGNIKQAFRFFFQRMHPYNVPIHRPTFHIETISAELLLSIVIAGSIYSYPRDNYYAALQAFDLLENAVFGSPELVELERTGFSHKTVVDCKKLEILNAAIIVMYLQLGMRDDQHRWRIRNVRFPVAVAACRAWSLFSIQQRNPLGLSVEDQWKQWIEMESVKR